MDSNHYEFTLKASEDLDEILNYISKDLCNQEAAKKFFNHLFADLDRLCLFPESCPLVDNEFIKRKDIRKSVIDNYLLYYSYDKEKALITILRIVYGKRNVFDIIYNI